MPADPYVLSVVIPTRGHPQVIRALESLTLAQGFHGLLVLVCGPLEDPAVAARFKALQSAHPNLVNPEETRAFTALPDKRNAGWKHATTEIVAFLDDDVIVEPAWAREIVKPFDDPEVKLVSGPGLIPPELPLGARLAGLALSSGAAGYVAGRYRPEHDHPRRIRWSRIIGCNMALRRAFLEEIGGFAPDFEAGDEMFVSHETFRRGHAIVFTPAARVDHYPRTRLARFLRQVFGYGVARTRLIRRGVEVEPASLIPALWVISLLVCGVGAFFHRAFGWLLGLDLALYFAAQAWATLRMVLRTRRAADLLLLVLIPVMHFTYGVAEIFEFFVPNRVK
ncbi:MAG: glycosyltransferase [Kiritimatiellae bacterium]|nr:glycosyltransferase [Kiritimatiellia bacterium]